MEKPDFNFKMTVSFDQSPGEVFNAINNVRGWWSEEIEGDTAKLNDIFNYRYLDVHNCKIQLIEVVQDKKIVWLVLDNYFSFTEDKTEWIGTKVIFEISEQDNKTELHFTHEGLVPAYECYGACVNGWTQYIGTSLPDLIRTGTGKPNKSETAFTVHEVAARFSELAKQEKWFEIQDALFADEVKSFEPENSPYFKNAEGKANVRQKGEDFVKRVTDGHRFYTSEPIVAGNRFAVAREMDITVEGLGRIQINEIMMYEVQNGQIVSEQFFY
jgi:hypothetical protein